MAKIILNLIGREIQRAANLANILKNLQTTVSFVRKVVAMGRFDRGFVEADRDKLF